MSSIGLLIKIELIHEIKFTFEDVIIVIIWIKLLCPINFLYFIHRIRISIRNETVSCILKFKRFLSLFLDLM